MGISDFDEPSQSSKWPISEREIKPIWPELIMTTVGLSRSNEYGLAERVIEVTLLRVSSGEQQIRSWIYSFSQRI